jgi:amidohydrolase
MSATLEVSKTAEDFEPEWKRWRRHLHSHPELAFEEHETAAFVAEKLRRFGYEVTTGVGKTGVVGVLRHGTGTRSLGLRADMDALPMSEHNNFAHASKRSGCMHACGHDGHTAMLLGAAQMLAATRAFSGTLVLIFQPAEEAAGGGRAMVEDGLFERFPVDAVYAMHNIPGIQAGHFGCMPGPMMASFDAFDIELEGQGGHAAFPHRAQDVISASAQLIGQLNSIVSRHVDPFEQAVVSVTQITAGDSYNILPASAFLRGTVRAFKSEMQDLIEQRMHAICRGIEESWQIKVRLKYERRYPPTVNAAVQAQLAHQVLTDTFGPNRVLEKAMPLMAAEDFAFMLLQRPGAYVWIGNGTGEQGGCMVHNPGYDFNDDITLSGVEFWQALVSRYLSYG